MCQILISCQQLLPASAPTGAKDNQGWKVAASTTTRATMESAVLNVVSKEARLIPNVPYLDDESTYSVLCRIQNCSFFLGKLVATIPVSLFTMQWRNIKKVIVSQSGTILVPDSLPLFDSLLLCSIPLFGSLCFFFCKWASPEFMWKLIRTFILRVGLFRVHACPNEMDQPKKQTPVLSKWSKDLRRKTTWRNALTAFQQP